MNKWIYILTLAVFFSTQACVDDIDDAFDLPASTRMTAALQEARDILISAPNGWLLEYYSAPGEVGGYTLLLAFKADGTVTIAGESELADCGITDSVPLRSTSLYQLKSDTGPTLTFDTYNSIFHIFSDPNPDGIGLSGDYEYTIEKATADEILLQGKKSNVKLALRKFPADTDWDTYLTDINILVNKAVAPDYTMNLEGQSIKIVQENSYGRTFLFQNEIGEDLGSTSYIYTSTGIKFYEPVTLDGKTMQNFDYNADKEAFVCTDEGIQAEIQLVFIPVNEYFTAYPGRWFFNSKLMSGIMLNTWNQGCQILTQKTGEKMYAAFLEYSPSDDMAFFNFICASDGTSANGLLSVIYSTVPDTENQILIEFEGRANQTGIVYYQNYGMNYLIAGITGWGLEMDYRHYSIEADNPRLPRKLVFTEVDDPSNQFTLTRKTVYWP